MTIRICVMAAIAFATALPFSALAKVAPEEAAKLKTELTPLGGIRAGNKEGTIPAWDGGYTTVPAGYVSGQPRPDPFADEKPLYSVNAANLDKYAEKVSEGQKALMKRYADYRIDVYPTHRTAAAPDWVYQNTFKNATDAESTDGGYTVKGAYGGLPFPIPQSGAEVMWNHLMRWRGEAADSDWTTWITDASGTVITAGVGKDRFNFPYYEKDGNLEKFLTVWKGNYFQAYQQTKGPPIKAGFAFILIDNIDQSIGRQAWQYLTGQRRVRRAPTFAYDTPNPVTSGVDFTDEPFILLGGIDKYSWKLVGKREMLVPYNNNGAMLAKNKDLVGPHFWNPDYVRYELHRVWVVEGTLRDGQRHVVPRKTFYLDEDTGNGIFMDGYDAQSRLWHTSIGLQTLHYDFPGVFIENFQTIDLVKGTYSSFNFNELTPQHAKVPMFPAKVMTPENMAAEALR